jgi:hypothetical protein
VIPTAIVAGLVLGVWLRWWAVPIVAFGWAVVIAYGEPSYALGGGLFGVVNGAFGVVFALGLQRVLGISMRPRGNLQSHRD